jgi:hypothetical protein
MMKKIISASLFVCFLFIGINAQNSNYVYNAVKKEYVLRSVTEARTEATRTHRMILADYQPAGIYVRRGERISINVTGLNQNYDLSSMIGFKPMWGRRNNNQENGLRNGVNVITAGQNGALSFIFVKKQGYDLKPSYVRVKVTGGKSFPLYKFNYTHPLNWENNVRRMKDAPFVQLFSDKVLITIPYQDYVKSPITDLAGSFRNIHNVIDWEDELAGFDNSSVPNMRTNNRVNFMVDIYATAEDRKKYYMYATNYLLGMKRDNFTELTHRLDNGWGIWHELGHTHQQRSWRWGSIGEISGNIFSLYVQEKFGRPSRLGDTQGGRTASPFEKAKIYLADPNKNYMVISRTDYDEFFTKLVMFHQLRAVYGWDVFKKLHQHFRKTPYRYDPNETEQDKVNKFVSALCRITGNNLLPFFYKWGLRVDRPTYHQINELKLRSPRVAPAKIFR